MNRRNLEQVFGGCICPLSMLVLEVKAGSDPRLFSKPVKLLLQGTLDQLN